MQNSAVLRRTDGDKFLRRFGFEIGAANGPRTVIQRGLCWNPMRLKRTPLPDKLRFKRQNGQNAQKRFRKPPDSVR